MGNTPHLKTAAYGSRSLSSTSSCPASYYFLRSAVIADHFTLGPGGGTGVILLLHNRTMQNCPTILDTGSSERLGRKQPESSSPKLGCGGGRSHCSTFTLARLRSGLLPDSQCFAETFNALVGLCVQSCIQGSKVSPKPPNSICIEHVQSFSCHYSPCRQQNSRLHSSYSVM